jgi:hypothetical protein
MDGFGEVLPPAAVVREHMEMNEEEQSTDDRWLSVCQSGERRSADIMTKLWG